LIWYVSNVSINLNQPDARPRMVVTASQSAAKKKREKHPEVLFKQASQTPADTSPARPQRPASCGTGM
jgi:hypothetical protein